jgi:hypothetical protein
MQKPVQADGREPGALNHPQPAEWMSYVYGELPRASRTRFQDHLRRCADCRLQVEGWEQAQQSLKAWRLAPRVSKVRLALAQPILKWALAALVVLGLGYGIGRMSMASTDTAAIRAAIEQPLRETLLAQMQAELASRFQADWHAALSGDPDAVDTEFRRQLRAGLDEWAMKTTAAAVSHDETLFNKFLTLYRANQQQDQQRMLTLVNDVDQKHQAEQRRLRQALETVAVVAADQLHRTQTELGQLASYTQAQFVSETPNEPSNSKGN